MIKHRFWAVSETFPPSLWGLAGNWSREGGQGAGRNYPVFQTSPARTRYPRWAKWYLVFSLSPRTWPGPSATTCATSSPTSRSMAFWGPCVSSRLSGRGSRASLLLSHHSSASALLCPTASLPCQHLRVPAPLALSLHLPLPCDGPARILLPFLIPCSHTLLIPLWSWLDPPTECLIPPSSQQTVEVILCMLQVWNQAGKLTTTSPLYSKYLMKFEVQGKKKAKLQNRIICFCRKQAWNKDGSLSTSIQVSAAPCKPHSNYQMSPCLVEILMIFPGFAGSWRVTGSCGSPRWITFQWKLILRSTETGWAPR